MSSDFSFVNAFFFHIHGDNGSGNLNVFKTIKYLNAMQNHWVVQIRIHIFAICLLRTTASFLKTTYYLLVDRGPFGRQNNTCGANGLPCGAKEPPKADASVCLV